MQERSNRRLHRAWVLVRWHILRRGRRLLHAFRDMPNNEADFVVRERRHIDEIRGYFPDYRTPGKGRRW